jgi:hypothetical protein
LEASTFLSVVVRIYFSGQSVPWYFSVLRYAGAESELAVGKTEHMRIMSQVHGAGTEYPTCFVNGGGVQAGVYATAAGSELEIKFPVLHVAAIPLFRARLKLKYANERIPGLSCGIAHMSWIAATEEFGACLARTICAAVPTGSEFKLGRACTSTYFSLPIGIRSEIKTRCSAAAGVQGVPKNRTMYPMANIYTQRDSPSQGKLPYLFFHPGSHSYELRHNCSV